MKSDILGKGLVLLYLVPFIAALPSWLNPLQRDTNPANAPRQYDAYAQPQYGGHYSYGGYGPQPTLSTRSSSQSPTSIAEGISTCLYSCSGLCFIVANLRVIASSALSSGTSTTGFSSGFLTGTSVQLSTGTGLLSSSRPYSNPSYEDPGSGTSSAAGVVPSSSDLSSTRM